jgi:hypothetical protein
MEKEDNIKPDFSRFAKYLDNVLEKPGAPAVGRVIRR